MVWLYIPEQGAPDHGWQRHNASATLRSHLTAHGNRLLRHAMLQSPDMEHS